MPECEDSFGDGYLQFRKDCQRPSLQVEDIYREDIYSAFMHRLPSWRKGFSQVYALCPKEDYDYFVVERFSVNANRLMVCKGCEEKSRELFYELLWENGLIGEMQELPYFIENEKGTTVILFFSDNGEIKIPYCRLPKGSVFVEFGCGEKSKRAIFQKRPDIKYYSLFGFLDNTVKSRYNSLVNMGVLSKYRIKNTK